MPGGNSERPRQTVARGIELACPGEDPKERLLRGVVGFRRREKAPGEAPQEGPETGKERIERRAVAARQRRQLLVDRGSPGRVQPRPPGLTSSSRSGRRSSGRRSAGRPCGSPPRPLPTKAPPLPG